MSSLSYLRRTPSAGLLLVQLLGILLYPWMETSPRGRALFGAFGLLILGGALRVVRRSPWLTWLALVLALLVAALSVIHAIAPNPACSGCSGPGGSNRARRFRWRLKRCRRRVLART